MAVSPRGLIGRAIHEGGGEPIYWSKIEIAATRVAYYRERGAVDWRSIRPLRPLRYPLLDKQSIRQNEEAFWSKA
jgi:hypothetical protein